MIIPGAKRIANTYWESEEVLRLSQEILGCYLATNINGEFCYGRIVETEAYEGINDKAAHVFDDRKTERTKVMYGKSGHAYIYLCYGMHHLLNIVTAPEGIPHAILIRGIEPVLGEEIMALRSNKKVGDKRIGRGPGNVSKAMGLHYKMTGVSLDSEHIGIFKPDEFPHFNIIRGSRIGVAYAKEDALRPNRFWIENNPHVSK